MSHLAVTTATKSSRTESTPLMQDTPSILHRICSCAYKIISKNNHESQNSSHDNTPAPSSFLQRLSEFNTAYSGYHCEIDYNPRALWDAEVREGPPIYPGYQSFKYIDTSRGG
jgi:hypothetical protein